MAEDTTPITLDDLKRVQLQPGDVLVYRFDFTLTYRDFERVRAAHRHAFGDDQRAVVLDEGAELHVVAPEAVPATAREL